MLYIAGVCNVVYASLLFLRAFRKEFRPYSSYRRAVACSAIAMLVFGLPYFIHAIFSVRLLMPILATVIGLTSFHIGAALFAYSYIAMLTPQWLTVRRTVVNVVLTVIGVITYWSTALYAFLEMFVYDTTGKEFMNGWPDIPFWIYIPFFIHASYLAFRTYELYIKARKTDPAATQNTLRPFVEALPKSVHLIVLCGIGSIVLYCIFPEGIILYTILMFVAYFAFYYIYCALTNYGKYLLEKENIDNSKSKWHRFIISYNSVYHSILLFAILGVFYIFSDKHDRSSTTDYDYPYLNLTKHALWDNPDFDEHQMTELFTLLYTNIDSRYFTQLIELYDDTTAYERGKVMLDDINSMPDSRYKGAVQVLASEIVFSFMPKELITADNIHRYISTIYKIAEGKTPISQQAFFTCWENAMACYTDINAFDSVRNEADRLLTICRQQNVPYGTVSAYSALSYCQEKSNDYENASSNMEMAIDTYDKFYTEKYGKDWQSKDKDVTNLLFNYYFMMSKNARYRVECGDTIWCRQHIKEFENIEKDIRGTFNGPILRNLYYSLAIYHDKWGDSHKYEKYMKLFRVIVDKASPNRIYGKQAEKELYYTALVRHALRNNKPEEAMKYINCLPDYFRDYRMSYYPDALLQLGKYKEAAEWYKQTIDFYYYQQLNGRNRSIIASMTSGVGEGSHQLEIMQAQLSNQQTRLMYNSLLIFVLAIMIGGLAYFIYGQYRLNKKLSASIEAEERAKNVRDIFLKNMTHEFHTPLNAVYGFAQILSDKSIPLDEESTREMANEMVKSSEHITKILDNIVDVTNKLSKLNRLEDVESIIKNQKEEET